jgi:hypothetical protein
MNIMLLTVNHTGTQSKKKGKATPSKKTKPKKTGPKKKGKTLRENEMELNNDFAEKIFVKDDGIFCCKNCPKFATSSFQATPVPSA